MGPVAAVHAHDGALVPELRRVTGRSAQRLDPVGGQALRVLGVEAVAERLADDLVGHHPLVPGPGQAEQPLVAARGDVHAVHPITLRRTPPAARSLRATRDDVKLVLGGEYGSGRPARPVSPGMSRL